MHYEHEENESDKKECEVLYHQRVEIINTLLQKKRILSLQWYKEFNLNLLDKYLGYVGCVTNADDLLRGLIAENERRAKDRLVSDGDKEKYAEIFNTFVGELSDKGYEYYLKEEWP